ncbi:unnamed protein product [Somion occarium]|uniref:F-box domain-containing protein n=1 Tax=Somion occarium TaxID=3059160 RepID=A0ABP1E3C0_9APHY
MATTRHDLNHAPLNGAIQATVHDLDKNNKPKTIDKSISANHVPPLFRLPGELLILIGEFYNEEMFRLLSINASVSGRAVQPYDFLALSQVCRRLRGVLISAANLWTIIPSLPSTDRDLVLELLQRAEPYSVAFFAVTKDPYEQLVPQIRAALPQVHTMAVEFALDFDDVTPADFHPVVGIAPQLQSLAIKQTAIPDTGEVEIPDILDGVDMPKLRSLEVMNLEFIPAQFPWSTALTKLTLTVSPDVGLTFTIPPIQDLPDVFDLLRELPQLEDLELNGAISSLGNNFSSLSDVKVELPYLRRIQVANHGRAPLFLLKHVDMPSNAVIQLQFKSLMFPGSIVQVVEAVNEKLNVSAPLFALAIRPVDGGHSGVLVDGYAGVSSLQQMCSGDILPQLQLQFPPFGREPWVPVFFSAISRLPLSEVGVLYMGDWSVKTLTEDSLVTLLHEMPRLHTLCWADPVTQHLPSVLLANVNDLKSSDALDVVVQRPPRLDSPLITPSIRTLIIHNASLGGDADAIQVFQNLRTALYLRYTQCMPIDTLLFHHCKNLSKEDVSSLASLVNKCIWDDTVVLLA